MQRITADDHLNNRFTDGDPNTNVPATVLDAAWLNGVQEEMVKVIESSGQTLSNSDYEQVIKALAHHVSMLDFYNAPYSDSADLQTRTFSLNRNTSKYPFPPVASHVTDPYVDGQEVRFLATAVNNIATTGIYTEVLITTQAPRYVLYHDENGDVQQAGNAEVWGKYSFVQLVFNAQHDAWFLEHDLIEHMVHREIDKVVAINTSGRWSIAPNNSQLLEALASHVGTMDYYNAAATADAFTLTRTDAAITPYVPLSGGDYINGLRVRFISPRTTTTDNPTLRINTGPFRSIRALHDLTPLPAGDIAIGEEVELTYVAAQDAWIISGRVSGSASGVHRIGDYTESYAPGKVGPPGSTTYAFFEWADPFDNQLNVTLSTDTGWENKGIVLPNDISGTFRIYAWWWVSGDKNYAQYVSVCAGNENNYHEIGKYQNFSQRGSLYNFVEDVPLPHPSVTGAPARTIHLRMEKRPRDNEYLGWGAGIKIIYRGP